MKRKKENRLQRSITEHLLKSIRVTRGKHDSLQGQIKLLLHYSPPSFPHFYMNIQDNKLAAGKNLIWIRV